MLSIEKPKKNNLQGVIIAGGLSRRMDGVFKGGIKLAGKPLLGHVIDRLKPQLEHLTINANQCKLNLSKFNLPIFEDRSPYVGEGPLAGIRTALLEYPNSWILTVPCDAPILPQDLVSKMLKTSSEFEADAYYAHDGERAHPLFSLHSPVLLSAMTDFLAAGNRRMTDWLKQIQACPVDFSEQIESFTNCNTPEQLSELESLFKDRKKHD